MTYYKDLSPYKYDDGLVNQVAALMASGTAPSLLVDTQALSRAVNVGWLDGWRPYRLGRVGSDFVAELFRVCSQSRWGHRGIHLCNLGWCRFDSRFKPKSEKRDGSVIELGSHVVIVPGRDRTYAAPDLIYHYVVRHHYRPPNEFIEAVLCQRPLQ